MSSDPTSVLGEEAQTKKNIRLLYYKKLFYESGAPVGRAGNTPEIM